MVAEAQATPREDDNSLDAATAEGAQSSLKTPKDKACPFCGQAFTSSSLGRHLDLYIRPKNPKAPDGVHIVDEIRKIRGNITRRQVKSTVKRDSETPAKGKSIRGEESPTVGASEDGDTDDLELVLKKQRGPFKDVSWGGLKTPEVRRDLSRQMQKADLDQRQHMSEEADTARATELALRELLRSVKDANAKATGLALFDFDPYTLNFPSLCLQILPPPSTLFSPTPFPTNESWSINPPGQKQLEALNRQVRERLLAHQRQRQINQAYPSGSQSNPSSGANSPLPTPPLFDPDPQKLFCHIADAYSHWIHQPDKARQEYWQVEILRSYARAHDMRREAEMQLECARREIEYLKSTRWSSGGPELSPVSITLGNETVKELGRHGMDFRNWDYDRMVEKWKMIVRESRNVTNGMAAQKQLPELPSRTCSAAGLPTQSYASVNGVGSNVKMETLPYSAPPTINGTEPSSDQVDAEGEEDDEDADLEIVPASNNGPMEEHHVLPHQPTPIHPVQMHAHLQSQAQAQAHAQAQAQAQHVQAQVQAQVWAARQHMNQSRNQHHHPHQHQQLSPHPQHIASAATSRRPSAVMMEAAHMSTGGMLPMDGIEGHQDQFLRMDMGVVTGFVGSNADRV